MKTDSNTLEKYFSFYDRPETKTNKKQMVWAKQKQSNENTTARNLVALPSGYGLKLNAGVQFACPAKHI